MASKVALQFLGQTGEYLVPGQGVGFSPEDSSSHGGTGWEGVRSSFSHREGRGDESAARGGIVRGGVADAAFAFRVRRNPGPS